MKPFSFAAFNRVQMFFVFLAFGLVAYSNAINHPFVHDEMVFIAQNPRIGQFDLQDIFRPKKIEGPAAGLVNVYYRPVIELMYRLEYQLFGLKAPGYHLFNILLHSFNAFLLFLLLSRIFPAALTANFLTALFFLVHPVQTEAVACISGISNLCLTAALFAGFLLYIKGREKGANRYYGWSLVLLLLGCFLKEQMIVLPVLVLLYELVFHDGKNRPYAKVLGLFLVLAGYFLLRKLILGAGLTHIFDPAGEHWLRFAAIPRSVLMYLSIILVPVHLHYYRSLDVLQPNAPAWIILGALAAALLGLIVTCKTEQKKVLLFGAGWFVITLLPVLNIVPLVHEYSTILNFEHFLYLPMIGAVMVILALAAPLVKRAPNAAAVTGTVLIAVCVALTLKQNAAWRSEIALFTRALQYEESGRLRVLLGKAYYFENDFPRAIGQYDRALEIMQGYVQKAALAHIKEFYRGYVKEIYFDLAHCYESLQNNPQAVTMYQLALDIDPRDTTLYNNLAVVYIRDNRIDLATAQLEKALAIDGLNPQTRQNLAYCYVQAGQKEKADQLFKARKDTP